MQTKIFMHTKKAVESGCPSDRVFLVVDTYKDGRKTIYLAYKCRLTSQGIEHPGLKDPISINHIIGGAGRLEQYPNGAEPTAIFSKDSFYREITFDGLGQLISQSKNLPRQTIVDNNLQLALSAGEKLTAEERRAICNAMSNLQSAAKIRQAWDQR